MTAPRAKSETAPAGPLARARAGIAYLNANKRRFFWWWAAYQSIKGLITLSLIWVPLLLLWLNRV
ncbi:MAG: hypothetical protein AAGH87_09425 [Pseudomonadota bacterium]